MALAKMTVLAFELTASPFIGFITFPISLVGRAEKADSGDFGVLGCL